jgi:hypothetical protein
VPRAGPRRTYGAGTVTGTSVPDESWNATSSLGSGRAASKFRANARGATTKSTEAVSRRSYDRGNNTINHDYDQVILYLGVKPNAVVNYTGGELGVDFSRREPGLRVSGFQYDCCCAPVARCPRRSGSDAELPGSPNGITAAAFRNSLLCVPRRARVPDPDRYRDRRLNFPPDPHDPTYT